MSHADVGSRFGSVAVSARLDRTGHDNQDPSHPREHPRPTFKTVNFRAIDEQTFGGETCEGCAFDEMTTFDAESISHLAESSR